MSNDPSCCLILSGSSRGTRFRFRLVEGANTVGSRRENQICLTVSGVSKHHAVIRKTDERLTIEDLASKNGTFVNGERVDRASLSVGDRLGFAGLTLRMETTSAGDGRLAIDLEHEASSRAESALQHTPPVDLERSTPPPAAEGGGLVFPPSWRAGESPAMADLLAHMRMLAASDLPVLILGETGAGKEGVARTLHLSSPRSGGAFVAVNCTAIPAELLEAELFGIGSGVATGVLPREGRFSEAHGGTLFLDEIGDMPAQLQAKILRALQDGEVRPLGLRPVSLDVRIVAATHDDLAASIAAGRFRRDLFYRLAGVTLHLPSLRDRPEDIPGLIAHFLAAAVKHADKDVRGLTLEAMRSATAFPWPGNVRQLQHAVERWAHRCPDHQVIDAALVAEDLAATGGTHIADDPDAHSPRPATSEEGAATEARAVDPSSLTSLDLAAFERLLIREALRRSDGNLTRAAAALGLTRQALRRRLERHGLRPASSD